MPEQESVLPKHGRYRKLKTFQIVQLIYDITMRFCDRYIDRCSRTHDQMVQAAALKKEGGFTERLYKLRQSRRRG